MWRNARRLGLLLASFCLIGLAVAACATPAAPSTNVPSSENGSNVFQTPNPALNTPTPTFPGFTIGAWPSQYSPGNNDTITIYVICRIQDPTMVNPPKPAAGVVVSLSFQAAANAAASFAPQTEPTASDGIAAFTVQVNDPTSGVPIIVYASTNYGGVPYQAQTFFTPNPMASPTPTGPAGGTPGASATATP